MLLAPVFFFFLFLSPSLYSQTNKVPKEIAGINRSVDLPYGKISLKRSPFGFYLESDVLDPSKVECERSLTEVTRFLYFFSRSITARQELRDKCPQYKLGESYFSSDYKKGRNLSLENILKYYFKQKNKKDLTIENYFQVIQKLNSYKASILREVIILHWHFYFNRLDNVRIHLNNFISKDSNDYLLNLDYREERMILNDKDGRIRLKQVMDELLTLANSRLEGVIFNSLISYLSQFDWTEVAPELEGSIKERIGSIESDDLSVYIKDIRWGKTLPHNWGVKVREKLGEGALESYVKRFWTIPSQVKNENLVIPFLEYIYSPSTRISVLGKLLKLRDSKDDKEVKYYYDFVGSPVLAGKNLKGEVIIPSSAFQKKRVFYSELLTKKKWKIFSMFHLISLGDLKESYLDEI